VVKKTVIDKIFIIDKIGVDNSGVDNASLYTQPEDIWDVYKALAEVGPYFSIAAGFGNVHGVYKPGNVKLQPELLGKHQAYTKQQLSAKEDKPLYSPYSSIG
jgi:fructose-bisphosphate aldolase, class II